jgi:fermentation-respiration switch protein FrsA (DUF1100 family)
MEWLLVAAAVAVGICATAWWGQERLIFFPQPVVSTTHLPARAEPLEVTAADGAKLRGWIARGAAAPAPAVIYFGGNAEEASWILGEPRWPREWAIVAINYRGYGASEGAPGEPALTSDALAIYDALVQRADIDRRRIVVLGRSLGTAVAVHLAAERPIAGAVLASPFDSLTAIGRRHYPWLPVSLLLRHRFDAASTAIRNRMPLHVIVGDADTIIPPPHSRALFDAWAGPKSWQVIVGADHNDLGTFDAFWDGIVGFLNARLRAPPG